MKHDLTIPLFRRRQAFRVMNPSLFSILTLTFLNFSEPLVLGLSGVSFVLKGASNVAWET